VLFLHLSCLATCWLHNQERKDGCEWHAGPIYSTLWETRISHDHLLNSVTKWI